MSSVDDLSERRMMQAVGPVRQWPQYCYRATVVRVIDGDTLELDVDLGFQVRHRLKCRLLNINCPEMSTPEGKAARSFVVSWLEQHGAAVYVETTKDKSDSFGRYLAYVSTENHDLNQDLLHAGHAVAYTR